MSQIQSAQNALESGDRERAKALLAEAFAVAPGEAAALLARIAIQDGDFARAEALSRTALENYAPRAAITLADAIGRQGRRAEAELIAVDAISSNADSGLLRAVLGEQRVRQAKWDLGTQDFIDALSLDGRKEVVEHLWRVISDLTIGHRADKVPTARALTFLQRVEAGAPRVDQHLQQMFSTARQAIEQKTVLPQTAPRVLSAPPPQSSHASSQMETTGGQSAMSRSMAMESTGGQAALSRVGPLEATGGQSGSSHAAAAPPSRLAPDLMSALRHDRSLNESLQAGLQKLGLPVWPSKHTQPLDTIPAMAPRNLKIDRAEFQREHLNVASGSVGTEIIVERALQSLMLEVSSGTATTPLFDNVGLTQVEIALWDGVLDRMKPIPQIYLGETKRVDARVLGLGGFLGACVVKPGVATWSFHDNPAKSTIETAHGDLQPFAVAAEWVAATDKDDVLLDEFLGEARLLANLTSKFNARLDPTAGLNGTSLSMKLAELWLGFRWHPLDTGRTEVTDAIRPLNIFDDLVFFALDARFAPKVGKTASTAGEIAMAYVRRTGEFLVMGSRKHFARAIGVLIGELTSRHIVTVLDLFASFYRPKAEVFRDPERKPKLERRGNMTILQFGASIKGESAGFALIHEPQGAVPWQLIEV